MVGHPCFGGPRRDFGSESVSPDTKTEGVLRETEDRQVPIDETATV